MKHIHNIPITKEIQLINGFRNLSNTILLNYVLDSLSLGHNFAIPIEDTRDLSIAEYICSIENSVSYLSTTNRDEIQNKCCNICT